MSTLRLALFLAVFAPAEARAERHFVAQCSVLSEDLRTLWSFPGTLCSFLDQGRFVAATNSGFALYDAKQNQVWKIPDHVHHMVARLKGGDLALIASHVIQFKGAKVRSDKNSRYSSAGKLLGEFRIEPGKGIELGRTGGMEWCPGCVPGVTEEVTHVNSVHEIPESRSPIKGLHKGNLLICDPVSHGIYALDPKLKRITWSFSYRKLGYRMVHDAQLLANGNLLVYVNASEDSPQASFLAEIDPVKGKAIWTYAGNTEADRFYSDQHGNVQPLSDGSFLFTLKRDGKTEARVVTRAGDVKRRIELGAVFARPVQAVTEEDLSGFLKLNRGL